MVPDIPKHKKWFLNPIDQKSAVRYRTLRASVEEDHHTRLMRSSSRFQIKKTIINGSWYVIRFLMIQQYGSILKIVMDKFSNITTSCYHLNYGSNIISNDPISKINFQMGSCQSRSMVAQTREADAASSLTCRLCRPCPACSQTHAIMQCLLFLFHLYMHTLKYTKNFLIKYSKLVHQIKYLHSFYFNKKNY